MTARRPRLDARTTFLLDAVSYLVRTYPTAPWLADALAMAARDHADHHAAGTCEADEFGELCAEFTCPAKL